MATKKQSEKTADAENATFAISQRVIVQGNKGPCGPGTVIRIDGTEDEIENVVIRLDTGEKVEVKAGDVVTK